MPWAACTIGPSGKNPGPPVLTDAGLDRLVADILLLAEMDRLLDDDCDPDELEMPTGALTVPLTPRTMPEKRPENHINTGKQDE